MTPQKTGATRAAVLPLSFGLPFCTKSTRPAPLWKILPMHIIATKAGVTKKFPKAVWAAMQQTENEWVVAPPEVTPLGGHCNPGNQGSPGSQGNPGISGSHGSLGNITATTKKPKNSRHEIPDRAQQD